VIPTLLIQPLVENAIKHGIAPFSRRGRLAIRARVEEAGDRARVLVITVTDSGPGLRDVERAPARPGLGLRNIEQRLSRSYGESGTLRVTSSAGSGTTAEVRLPFTRSHTVVGEGAWQAGR
jgi:LytS/YehU family sensor histidine kinase